MFKNGKKVYLLFLKVKNGKLRKDMTVLMQQEDLKSSSLMACLMSNKTYIFPECWSYMIHQNDGLLKLRYTKYRTSTYNLMADKKI